MAPKKKEKKEPRERRAPVPALPEDLLQLTLQLRTAEAHVNELKHRTVADTAVVSQQSEAIAENETSMNDMHKYLEYQMLHAARERLTMQQNLREVEKSRAREVAEATSKMEKAAAAATETIGGLRAELAEAREELGGLQEFKAHRAELEKERADLKAALEAEQEARRREVHEAHLQWWTQRQDLNKEMLARIAQAKSNFLDITHEMLDSSVHRTLEENASIGEQLSYASTKMASLAKENNRLHEERAKLRRELELHEERSTEQVRRHVAGRRLAEATTRQHAVLADELDARTAELAEAKAEASRREAGASKLAAELDATRRHAADLSRQLAAAHAFIEERLRPLRTPPPTPPHVPEWDAEFGEPRPEPLDRLLTRPTRPARALQPQPPLAPRGPRPPPLRSVGPPSSASAEHSPDGALEEVSPLESPAAAAPFVGMLPPPKRAAPPARAEPSRAEPTDLLSAVLTQHARTAPSSTDLRTNSDTARRPPWGERPRPARRAVPAARPPTADQSVCSSANGSPKADDAPDDYYGLSGARLGLVPRPTTTPCGPSAGPMGSGALSARDRASSGGHRAGHRPFARPGAITHR